MNRRIAIEGVVGAGKTTVARMVAERIGSAFLGEASEKHPFLDAFYGNPARFALETEFAFLLIHYHQLFHDVPASVVADFCFTKDLVFARMNLRGRNLRMFEQLFEHLSENVPAANSVFFLRPPISACITRIKARGIPREQGITPQYLGALEETYIAHLHHLGEEVRILDVGGESDAEAITNLVIESLYGRAGAGEMQD